VQLPPHQDICLYVYFVLVELVACHCPVRVHFLITIHVIMEASLNTVKTHTRPQTRFAPVSPKAMSLDTQERSPCPLTDAREQRGRRRRPARGPPMRRRTDAREQRGRRRRPARGPPMHRPPHPRPPSWSRPPRLGLWTLCPPMRRFPHPRPCSLVPLQWEKRRKNKNPRTPTSVFISVYSVCQPKRSTFGALADIR